MVGDIVGRPGRELVAAALPELRDALGIDRVVANGENAARGRGLTEKTADELFAAGVDVITSGNHIFDVRDFVPLLDRQWPVLRPANYPPEAPGRGVFALEDLTVINLMGRVFMPAVVDDPFRVADQLLAELEPGASVVVDFHAEASSEQQALSWYLDGRVAAVVGTHTHVPTADARLLPEGTAAVGDLGMVGCARFDHRRRRRVGREPLPDRDAHTPAGRFGRGRCLQLGTDRDRPGTRPRDRHRARRSRAAAVVSGS